jgi:hypothetical protein
LSLITTHQAPHHHHSTSPSPHTFHVRMRVCGHEVCRRWQAISFGRPWNKRMLVDDCTRQEHDTRPEHSRPSRGCSHLLASREALLCCLDRDALLCCLDRDALRSCLVPPSRPEHARIACLLPPSSILVGWLYHAGSHTCRLTHMPCLGSHTSMCWHVVA